LDPQFAPRDRCCFWVGADLPAIFGAKLHCINCTNRLQASFYKDKRPLAVNGLLSLPL
jgi:hypothetical protein